MKNLIVNVSRETRMVILPKQFIAIDGENLQSKLVFTFIDEFVDGQARLEYEINGEKNYILLSKENDTYSMLVKNVMTKEGQIDMQLVITEGIDEEEIPVFKSNKFYLYCNSSINAVEEAPDGYELWIEEANAKLNQVDNVDIDIKSDDENVYVEITRKDGTKKDAIISDNSGGGSGTTDYNVLQNKPKINDIILEDNKTLDELGIQPKGSYLTSEKDPTVPLHVKNITEENISNWNNKSEFSGSYNDLKDIPTDNAKTNQNNNFSVGQTINGTLTINGDIVQNGESYETHAEQIYTEKDEIITRAGAVGGLSQNQLTGIRAKKYDGANDGQLGFDNTGTARVGDENDTQPLLTRDEAENLTDGQVLIWDANNLKAKGSSDYVKNNQVASETKLGLVKVWTSVNGDGDVGLNISTEV